MVAKQVLFLVVTLGGLVFLTFGTNIFETTFTDNQMEALITMTKLYFAASMYCFIVSELAKNYSQVDKFWSLIPIAYVWYFTNSAGFEPRMVLMSVLATIWGIRLTLNFARRGGFSIYFWKGEEDYRWVVENEWDEVEFLLNVKGDYGKEEIKTIESWKLSQKSG